MVPLGIWYRRKGWKKLEWWSYQYRRVMDGQTAIFRQQRPRFRLRRAGKKRLLANL